MCNNTYNILKIFSNILSCAKWFNTDTTLTQKPNMKNSYIQQTHTYSKLTIHISNCCVTHMRQTHNVHICKKTRYTKKHNMYIHDMYDSSGNSSCSTFKDFLDFSPKGAVEL